MYVFLKTDVFQCSTQSIKGFIYDNDLFILSYDYEESGGQSKPGVQTKVKAGLMLSLWYKKAVKLKANSTSRVIHQARLSLSFCS